MKTLLTTAIRVLAIVSITVFEARAATDGARSWWDVVVLGVPLYVLAAALVGSCARSFRDGSQPETTLPRRALLMLIDGIVGGWGAMFVLGFSSTRPFFVGIEPAVLGGFGGLLTQLVRDNGTRWFEQLWQAVIALITRKRAGDPTP